MMSFDTQREMLAAVTQAAFGISMAVNDELVAARGTDRWFDLVDLYARMSASVRMSITLDLRIQRESRLLARAAARGESETAEAPEMERLETEREERLERESLPVERDRDAERATLPLLLRTLGEVADAAETLLHPVPAELPTLRDLLAKFSEPAPVATPPRGEGAGVAVLARPKPATRTHLLTSVSRSGPLVEGLRPTPPPRRSPNSS